VNLAGGVATAIGSMPGTDIDDATRTVFELLPDLPYLPELPARGLGADTIGRSAAILVDLPIQSVPSGYRVASRAGPEHRRAADLLRFDLDALHETVARLGAPRTAVKVQVAGPWTLTAGIELERGHRVLTDAGALREFTGSLAEGIAAHVGEVASRAESPVVVQLDEPRLPAVLNGRLRSPSGLEHLAPVPEPAAESVLATVISAARRATGSPVIVHCCARRPPVTLLRRAGADALALDLTAVPAGTAATDAMGELLESGAELLAGLVPAAEPAARPALRELADPALRLLDRLGLPRETLMRQCTPTPVCGLAGTSRQWSRRALERCRELGAAFAEPPESW
jgi:methionine synthase II (cobalamin-independent)